MNLKNLEWDNFYIYMRKQGCSMKAMDKMYYLVALVLQGIALILEILPVGAVMVFATSPTERTIEVYSYFSMLPVGYANFTPLLTGILTILIVLLGVIALFKFDKATCIRKVIFVCSIVSLLFSIVPLFLFGAVGMTAASYAVSCMILLAPIAGALAPTNETCGSISAEWVAPPLRNIQQAFF